MLTANSIINWAVGDDFSALEKIHQNEVNIAIFKRSITKLKNELDELIKKDFTLRISGDIPTILKAIDTSTDLAESQLVRKDIGDLLSLFNSVIKSDSYKLYLATVSNNMCSRFHTDINDLRMLCTYKGPGTLWLEEDNVNWDAEDCCDDGECMVIDKSQIQRAETGAVVILKGAIYPGEGTKAVLHRSPTIEESGEKRLLLRIDTNEFAYL